VRTGPGRPRCGSGQAEEDRGVGAARRDGGRTSACALLRQADSSAALPRRTRLFVPPPANPSAPPSVWESGRPGRAGPQGGRRRPRRPWGEAGASRSRSGAPRAGAAGSRRRAAARREAGVGARAGRVPRPAPGGRAGGTPAGRPSVLRSLLSVPCSFPVLELSFMAS
jgi:hypothetical protein